MYERATTPMALRDFRAHLHGELILPDDDGYDSARRVWNGVESRYVVPPFWVKVSGSRTG